MLQKINDVFCDEHSRPYQDIRIRHTIVLDDPFDDPEGSTSAAARHAAADPPAAGLERHVPEESPPPTEAQLKARQVRAARPFSTPLTPWQTVRIADDEALVDNEGMSQAEVAQLEARKLVSPPPRVVDARALRSPRAVPKAKARATILEMVGDINDADEAPPENVLFVCKVGTAAAIHRRALLSS